jgi:hypothetical protein
MRGPPGPQGGSFPASLALGGRRQCGLVAREHIEAEEPAVPDLEHVPESHPNLDAASVAARGLPSVDRDVALPHGPHVDRL